MAFLCDCGELASIELSGLLPPAECEKCRMIGLLDPMAALIVRDFLRTGECYHCCQPFDTCELVYLDHLFSKKIFLYASDAKPITLPESIFPEEEGGYCLFCFLKYVGWWLLMIAAPCVGLYEDYSISFYGMEYLSLSPFANQVTLVDAEPYCFNLTFYPGVFYTDMCGYTRGTFRINEGHY
jgi:hypothetical protein